MKLRESASAVQQYLLGVSGRADRRGEFILIINSPKLRGLSPRADYTDRAAAAGRRS